MKVEMLKNMAIGRWRDILLTLAPALGEAIERNGRHVDCPIPGHGDSGRGDFRMFSDYEETGGAACTCGFYSDGFSLLEQINGWSFKETKDQVERYLVGQHPSLAQRTVVVARVLEDTEARKAEDRKIALRIATLWKEAFELDKPEALVACWYLESRRIQPRMVMQFKALRLHPALPYYDEKSEYQGHFPAMLAMFCDPSGKPITLHRTYLTPSGAKLPVTNAKKIMRLPSYATLTGGAIRLGKAERLMGVAEGIETALSVYCGTRQTVWSTYSANGMASFIPPPGVEEVWAWADHDQPHLRKKNGVEVEVRAGLEAAKTLKARLWSQQTMCRIMLPAIPINESGKGVDWNDVMMIEGYRGFPAARQYTPMRAGKVAGGEGEQ